MTIYNKVHCDTCGKAVRCARQQAANYWTCPKGHSIRTTMDNTATQTHGRIAEFVDFILIPSTSLGFYTRWIVCSIIIFITFKILTS